MEKPLSLIVGQATIAAGVLLVGCGSASHHSSHLVSGARNGITRAQLDVVSGASSVTVDAAPLGGDLYRVSTPAGSGLRPVAHVSHGRLRVSIAGSGHPARLTVELSRSVTWSLRLSGGATSLTTSFRTGRLSGIDLAAGDAHAVLTLPHPSGTVPILEDGGLSQLTVRVPGDVPTRVNIDGGAAHVGFDGVTHTGVAAGSVFSSPGWSAAHDRYELEAKGGVSSLLVLIEAG